MILVCMTDKCWIHTRGSTECIQNVVQRTLRCPVKGLIINEDNKKIDYKYEEFKQR